MKIVSAEEMRAIDRASSERYGVPSLTLMENAGAAVAEYVLSHHAAAERIVVFCGKGNNGGDGFVAARRLHEQGKKVQVILLAEPGDLRGDAAVMFGKLPGRAIAVRSSEELKGTRASLQADLFLDAVLGTGFKPPVSGLYADAIGIMNASGAPVIAVDIPSGADADAMGRQPGTIARADAVVTFTAPRPAHVFSMLTMGSDFCRRYRLSGSRDSFGVATECDHGAGCCDFDWAATRRVEQRQLRARAGGRRSAGEGGSGGDGGNGSAARWGGTFDGGDAEVRAGNRGRISSRVDDRAIARDGCGHNLDSARRIELTSWRKERACSRSGREFHGIRRLRNWCEPWLRDYKFLWWWMLTA